LTIWLFAVWGEAPSKIFFKMAKYDELPVYKASYDLLLEIFLFVKEFSKEFKYTVGESLKKIVGGEL
jgi:hypothetical protein